MIEGKSGCLGPKGGGMSGSRQDQTNTLDYKNISSQYLRCWQPGSSLALSNQICFPSLFPSPGWCQRSSCTPILFCSDWSQCTLKWVYSTPLGTGTLIDSCIWYIHPTTPGRVGWSFHLSRTPWQGIEPYSRSSQHWVSRSKTQPLLSDSTWSGPQRYWYLDQSRSLPISQLRGPCTLQEKSTYRIPSWTFSALWEYCAPRLCWQGTCTSSGTWTFRVTFSPGVY